MRGRQAGQHGPHQGGLTHTGVAKHNQVAAQVKFQRNLPGLGRVVNQANHRPQRSATPIHAGPQPFGVAVKPVGHGRGQGEGAIVLSIVHGRL